MKKQILVLTKYKRGIWAILKLSCPSCGKRFEYDDMVREIGSKEFAHENCIENDKLKRSGNLANDDFIYNHRFND